MKDPYANIQQQCQISQSQQHTLAHSPFALQHAFSSPPPPSPPLNGSGDDYWPESSSSSGDPQYDVFPITFFSPPETPEPEPEPEPESPPVEFKTPPEVPCSASGGSNDVVSCNSGNLGFCGSTETEVLSIEENTHKMDDTDGVENLKFKLNSNSNSNSELRVEEKKGIKGVVELLRVIASRRRRRDESDNTEEEEIDIFETAKRRGMTFPKSRWYGGN